MLDSLVEEEFKRQKAKTKETKRKSQPAPNKLSHGSPDNLIGTVPQESLTFDQQIDDCLDTLGNPIRFQTIQSKILIRK